MLLINTKDIKSITFLKEELVSNYKYTCAYKRKYLFFGPKIYYECWELEHCQFTREDILENPSLRIVGDSVYIKALLKIDSEKYYFSNNANAEKALNRILSANPNIVVIQ